MALATALALAASGGPARAGVGQRGTAGSSGDAGRSGPERISAQPAGSLPGLDVSHWQGPIDWAEVAADGQRFAIAKATEGQTFEDPMYASYRANAEANGLAFTAYHFARPDDTRNDAVLEADHFVDVAALGPGNLIPSLDVERTGGLDPQQLTRWVLDWLAEVTARLGVKPMVYTSPIGWQNRFDDTTAIADAGYTVLWVAHWNVSTPTLPANDWEGNGWTFWQHTDCATVPGISDCVDHDWYRAGSFDPVTIRGLTVSVDQPDGTVSTSPARFACTSTCSANFDPGTTVTLTATPNAGAVFQGWGGACAGSSPTCTVTMDADRSVTASFATDVTPPTPTILAPSALGDPVTVSFDERVTGVTSANVVLSVEAGDRVVRGTVSCRSRTGSAVACTSEKVRSALLQPDEPLVPGQAYLVTVDPSGVPPVVDRAGNPAATTSAPFTGSTALEQDAPGVTYRWATVSDDRAFGGSFAVERDAGATASFPFRGRSVTWYTVVGPDQGKARVSIDGVRVATVNDYAAAERFRVARSFGGLTRGPHAISITALGRSGSRHAVDDLVAVDGFGVGGDLVRSPALETSWRSVKDSAASGRSVAVSDVAGASVSVTFRGTSIDWYTVTGPDQGKAAVYLDGALVKTVNGYAATTSDGVARSFGGLADGLHTLRVVVLGRSRPATTDALVTIDRFAVG